MKKIFVLFALVLSFLTGCAKESTAVGIIGGADGPTSIMISGPDIPLAAIAFGLVLIVIVVIVFIVNKKD